MRASSSGRVASTRRAACTATEGTGPPSAYPKREAMVRKRVASRASDGATVSGYPRARSVMNDSKPKGRGSSVGPCGTREPILAIGTLRYARALHSGVGVGNLTVDCDIGNVALWFAAISCRGSLMSQHRCPSTFAVHAQVHATSRTTTSSHPLPLCRRHRRRQSQRCRRSRQLTRAGSGENCFAARGRRRDARRCHVDGHAGGAQQRLRD